MQRNPPPGTSAKRIQLTAAAAAVVFSSVLVRSASAATWVWTGGATDADWSSTLNWTPAGPPASDGTADITMTGTTKKESQLDLPWAVNSLSFATMTGAITLSGESLTLGSGGIQNQSSFVQTFNTPVVIDTDQVWNSGANTAGGLIFNNSVDTSGHTLTFTGSGTALNGPITGTGTLVVNMSPAATLLLRGANTYSGGTVINQGTLYIETPDRLGAAGAPVTFNGGQLNIASPMTISHDITLASAAQINSIGGGQSSSVTLSGNIQGPGSLRIHGVGDTYVYLTGHNSYTGGTTVDQITLSGNTDSLTGNISLVNQYAQVQFQQAINGTYSGNISGGGEVIKRGNGTLALTGNINVTSGIGLYGGVLELYNGGANISPSTGIGFVQYGAYSVIQFVGGATFTRSNIGWGYSGGFAARDGKLTVNLGGSGATFNLMPHCDLVFGSDTSNSVTEFQNPIFLGNNKTSPDPTVQVNAGVGGDYAVLSGPISGGNWLLKTGNGLLKLTAANTFTGELILNAGTTLAADGVGLPSAAPLQFSGGVWLGNGPTTFTRSVGTAAGQVNWIAGGGGFAASGGTLTVNLGGAAAVQTWGTAGFVPIGSPLILGSPYAEAETLFVNPINLGSAPREVRVNAGLGGDIATLSGPLTGAGGINKTGPGQLRLAAANTYTGGTLVSAGTLIAANDSALGPPTAGLSMSPAGGAVATVKFMTANPVIGRLSSSGAGVSGIILGNADGSSPTTLTAGYGNASSSTFSGNITDLVMLDAAAVGSLVKAGPGTLVLSGSNTYAGPTVATGGTIVLRPTAWAPVLTLTGGGVMAGGRLAFNYAGSDSPRPAILSLLQSGYLAGFAATRLRNATPDAYHGIGWTDESGASQLTLLGAWYGDANLNGRIDQDDFALIDRAVAMGLSAEWVNGDFNYDGSINNADYLLLDTSAIASGAIAPTGAFLAAREAQFGEEYVSALVSSIPEPACIGIGAVSVLTLRRRPRGHSVHC